MKFPGKWKLISIQNKGKALTHFPDLRNPEEVYAAPPWGAAPIGDHGPCAGYTDAALSGEMHLSCIPQQGRRKANPSHGSANYKSYILLPRAEKTKGKFHVVSFFSLGSVVMLLDDTTCSLS